MLAKNSSLLKCQYSYAYHSVARSCEGYWPIILLVEACRAPLLLIAEPDRVRCSLCVQMPTFVIGVGWQQLHEGPGQQMCNGRDKYCGRHALAVKLTEGAPRMESYLCHATVSAFPSFEGNLHVCTRLVV